MANYSSKDFSVQIKDHGGTLRTIGGAGLRSVGNIGVEAIIQESTAFGSAWATYLSTGIKKLAAIVIGGFYDDTAVSGLDVLFAGFEGDLRTGTVFTYGSTKTSTVDTLVSKYERMPKINAETEVQVTLQPTGLVTET